MNNKFNNYRFQKEWEWDITLYQLQLSYFNIIINESSVRLLLLLEFKLNNENWYQAISNSHKLFDPFLLWTLSTFKNSVKFWSSFFAHSRMTSYVLFRCQTSKSDILTLFVRFRMLWNWKERRLADEMFKCYVLTKCKSS